MEIDGRRRHQLGTDARRAMGEGSGTTLMELLPPVGWADVATKHDLAALEQRLDLRFAIIEQRFDAKLDSVEQRLVARMERGFRQVLVTVCALVVGGFAASIVASLAR
jgi:hypothetical protein